MNPYSPKKFSIPALQGISEKTVTTHLSLYEGYVKYTNTLLERLSGLSNELDNHGVILSFQKRFSFEFDGMRNHEYYFSSFEGGAKPLADNAPLRSIIAKEWGSFDAWLERFKVIATTRGVGWAMLYYDMDAGRLLNAWVDEQHLGHLTGLSPIVALDMWEHSYLLDYAPADKGKYVEAYFANLNWETVARRLDEAVQRKA